VEEDKHQQGKETGQEGVQYDVEQQNLGPTLEGASQDLVGPGIVQEMLEGRFLRRSLGHEIDIAALLVTHFVHWG